MPNDKGILSKEQIKKACEMCRTRNHPGCTQMYSPDPGHWICKAWLKRASENALSGQPGEKLVEILARELFDVWVEAKENCADSWAETTFDSLPDKHKDEYFKTARRILSKSIAPIMAARVEEAYKQGYLESAAKSTILIEQARVEERKAIGEKLIKIAGKDCRQK